MNHLLYHLMVVSTYLASLAGVYTTMKSVGSRKFPMWWLLMVSLVLVVGIFANLAIDDVWPGLVAAAVFIGSGWYVGHRMITRKEKVEKN